MLFPALLLLAANLTGLWYGPPPANANNNRDLYIALEVDAKKGTVTGTVESPTRRAPIAEGRLNETGTAFTGVLAHIWDAQAVRRPIRAELRGDVLHVSVQGWPGGPMQSFDLRRISAKPSIAQIPTIPAPPLRDDLARTTASIAPTPPMGWNSWNKFGCRVDDRMIREMADAMVSSGMRDAGYRYVNIDDCWQNLKPARDGKGNILPDPKRFPDMKALADYVHARGLKLGIYSSPGPRTCAGFEGSYGHEEQDAKQYAAWGIDLLKYDWCSAGKYYPDSQMRAVYQKMGAALQAAGRPILYSLCQYGLEEVWKWGPLVGGNSWRTTSDIGDNWKSIEEIAFVRQVNLAPFAGPTKGWNDPDMLEIGNGGISAEEYRTHMSIWALQAAPLLAGNDLRSMTPEIRSILLNRDVIAIDQDPLGQPATRVWSKGGMEVWARPLKDGDWAVGVFNRNASEATAQFEWTSLGLPGRALKARNLWTGSELPEGSLSGEYHGSVPRHGVLLLRVSF